MGTKDRLISAARFFFTDKAAEELKREKELYSQAALKAPRPQETGQPDGQETSWDVSNPSSGANPLNPGNAVHDILLPPDQPIH